MNCANSQLSKMKRATFTALNNSNTENIPNNTSDVIWLRCPICNKKLALISAADVSIHYLQLKCPRCKIEFYYTDGKIYIK